EAAGYPYDRVDTVFFGGGTPTLLPADDLVAMLDHLRGLIPLAADAEVTTEANPDSVTRASLSRLAAGGVTRVSFGMQSAVRSVLATLDRTHDPERVPQAVAWAREAGLDVSLDLIYGTPGETIADVEASVRPALDCGIDHMSAYSLIIEGNTAMARQLRRGELEEPDPDDMADKYELIEELATADGLSWYEVSNWARTEAQRCRHNLAYWRGRDWWGIGPGAHRHRDGLRAWNVKHPSRYARMLADDRRGRGAAAGPAARRSAGAARAGAAPPLAPPRPRRPRAPEAAAPGRGAPGGAPRRPAAGQCAKPRPSAHTLILLPLPQ